MSSRTMLGLLRTIALIIAVGISSTDGKFKNLKALTYNTGLVETLVPVAMSVTRKQRRDTIIDALNATDAQFVCLQEVYFAQDVEAIVEGVKDKFPHSFSKIHDKDGTVDGTEGPPNDPVCDVATFIPLSNCLAANCAEATILTDRVLCAGQFCLAELQTMFVSSSQDCLSCFSATLPYALAFFDRCTNPARAIRVNAPGLLLLSTKRLENERFVDFHPDTTEFINRGYLHAKVGSNKNKILAACTHVSSIAPTYIELNLLTAGIFQSFEEQNLFELGKLIEKFGNKRQVVVLGDFSTAPALPGLLPFFEDHYAALTAVFDTAQLSECTLCPTSENIYNRVDQNVQIDHIFARGVDIKRERRELTPNLCNVVTYDFPMPCSVHFGVSAKLKAQ